MIDHGIPVVSCVMVTCGRPDLVKKSIACYLSQTYPNKQLVVASQGNEENNQKINSFIKNLRRNDIIFQDAPKNLSLGSLRNLSIELATGDLICQWDDDDLSHPNRIVSQYRMLTSDDRNVASMYSEFLKYYRTTGDLYWCDWSGEKLPQGKYICNTLMFYKKLFGRVFYPEVGPQCQFEEDLNLLIQLLSIGSVSMVKNGKEFVYVYHGKNVYDISHHNHTLNTSTGKKVYGREYLMERKNEIEETLILTGIDQNVSVVGLDGVAFNWSKGN